MDDVDFAARQKNLQALQVDPFAGVEFPHRPDRYAVVAFDGRHGQPFVQLAPTLGAATDLIAVEGETATLHDLDTGEQLDFAIRVEVVGDE